MLKNTHLDATAALSLLPLMDPENNDSADLVPNASAASATTSRLLEREATNIAAQILRSSDIADFVKDLGYNCTATVEAFRQAIKGSGVPMDERQAALLLCLVAVTHTGLGNDKANELWAQATPRLHGGASATRAAAGGDDTRARAHGTWR